MEKASLLFDKRKYPRLEVDIPIQFTLLNSDAADTGTDANPAFEASSRDLSIDGLFIVSTLLLKKGDILKAEVPIPKTQKVIKAFAEVVWVSDAGVPAGQHGAGVSFITQQNSDAKSLRQFIANLLKGN